MPIRLKTNLVIDFHTYLGRDAYNDFYQGAGELLQAMDEHGIDMAVVSPFQDYPGPDAESLSRVYEASRAYPDRFVPFARRDPRYGDIVLQKLGEAIEKFGVRGLLFNPLTTQTPIHHPALLPLMEAMASYNLPVLIPTGNSYFGLPEHVVVLAKTLPSLKIIIGHMGTAPHATRAIDIAGRFENIYLETSLQQSTNRISLAVNSCGAEKIFFGSASPYGHSFPEKEKIMGAGLKQLEQGLVLGFNAQKILGIA